MRYFSTPRANGGMNLVINHSLRQAYQGDDELPIGSQRPSSNTNKEMNHSEVIRTRSKQSYSASEACYRITGDCSSYY